MVDTDGRGVDSGALVCTCIACAPCTAIIRVAGVVCVPTGTSGDATIITSGPVGSGADGDELGVICIACAHINVGLDHAG